MESQTLSTCELSKTLSLLDGIGLVFGIMIGTGIFSSPGAVLATVHNSVGVSLCVWLGSGLLCLLGGLCYSELAASIPKSGGSYNYLSQGIHPLFGFLFTWACFLCLRTGSLAIISIGFGEYFGSVIFSLDLRDPLIVQDYRVKLLAMTAISTLTTLNLFSVQKSIRIQHILVTFKFIAIGLVIMLACIGLFSKTTIDTAKDNFTNLFTVQEPWESSNDIITSIGIAVVFALWAYDGFSNITSVAEEMKNPGKNIPIALIVSISGVILVYTLINVAYFCVIPANVVATSPAIAVEMAKIVGGVPCEILMQLLISLSALGAINGGIITSSRIFYAAAREGSFPLSSYVSKVSKKEVPFVAIILQGCTALLIVIPGNFKGLVNYFGVTAWIFYVLVAIGLIRLRYTQKNIPRPFKVWPFPLLPIVFILLSLCLLITTFAGSPFPSILGLVVVLSGVPIYFLFFWKQNLCMSMLAHWRNKNSSQTNHIERQELVQASNIIHYGQRGESV